MVRPPSRNNITDKRVKSVFESSHAYSTKVYGRYRSTFYAGTMEVLPETFVTEYRLLEAYHVRRKSRSNARRKITLQRKSECALSAVSASVDTDDFADVAEGLTQIVNSVPLAPEEIVPEGDDVIQRIVELLKESGDKLNQEIQRDHELSGFLQKSFSYSMFETLASAFIHAVVPDSGKAERPSEKKAQIAWTFEMTSRLSVLDLQPMNRSMGFGAQFLHKHFAPWIQQHGGWEKVFNKDEGDEEIQ